MSLYFIQSNAEWPGYYQCDIGFEWMYEYVWSSGQSNLYCVESYVNTAPPSDYSGTFEQYCKTTCERFGPTSCAGINILSNECNTCNHAHPMDLQQDLTPRTGSVFFYYIAVSDPRCLPCPIGMYKDNTDHYLENGLGTGLCIDCPTGATTYSTGAKSLQSCNCDYGYEITLSGCVECSAGKYAANNECIDCAENSWSSSGAQIQDCLCNVGYTGAYGHHCTQCELGKYKDTTGSSECVDCSAGYISSSSYTMCEPCPAGTYESLGVCLNCRENSYSESGSTLLGCLCNPGFEFVLEENVYICKQCTTGKKKSLQGNGICVSCLSGSTTPSRDGHTSLDPYTSCTPCVAGKYEWNHVCENCPANSNSVEGSTYNDCVCNAGYAGYYFIFSGNRGGLCTECVAGTFSAVPDSTACTLCDPGQTSVSPFTSCTNCVSGKYTNDLRECQSCPVNTYSDDGSTQIDDCLCNAGYFGQPSACAECPAGHYKSNLGSEAALGLPCLNCLIGTYQPQTASSSCLSCPLSKYAHEAGATVCTDCEAGKTTLSTGSNDISECISCDAGYGFVEGSGCQQCTAGTYSTNVYNGCSTDSVQCLLFSIIPCCHHQMYICLQCLAGENSLPGTSTCTCDVGYSWTLMPTGAYGCIACEVGKFKGTIGTVACETCVSGTFSSLAATTCQTCAASFPNNIAHSWYTSSGSSTQDDCVAICGLGFGNDNNGQECHECLANTSSATIDTNPCQPCPENRISTAGASECICPEGQEGITLGCRCNQGYYLSTQLSESACIPCNINTFIADDAHDKNVCNQCPELSGTNGLIGQYSCDFCVNNLMKDPSDNVCKCPPGTTTDVNVQNSCISCANNFVKNTYGSAICSECTFPFQHNALRTKCVCADNYGSIDGLCIPCVENAVSTGGSPCICKFGYVMQDVIIQNVDGTQNVSSVCVKNELENCVVNRRIPKFAIQYQFKSSPGISTHYSSREKGGVCYMERLSMLNNTAVQYQDPNVDFSYQMCAQNSTSLQCIMLAQNRSSIENSYQKIFNFDLKQQYPTTENLLLPHSRKKLCSACDKHAANKLLTRFNQKTTISGEKQLSFGLPYRLSTERLIFAFLHKAVCSANSSCSVLSNWLCDEENINCLQRKQSMQILFQKTHMLNLEHIESSNDNLAPTANLLWKRNWVFCKYLKNVNQIQTCQGNIPKEVWLNHKTRYEACTNIFQNITKEDTNVIHFCLLNKDTAQLCQQMIEWKETVRHILCQSAGLCPSTAFFYSPTQFNLQEKEFVYDTVMRFYQTQAGKSCTTASSTETLEQRLSNHDKLENCASVQIQPFVTITQQVRKAKRIIVVIMYHYYRIIWHLLHVMSLTLMNMGVTLARQSSDALEIAISKLMREVIAFVQSVGSLIDNIGQTVLKLVTSRGIGKQLKWLFKYICLALEFIYNKIWNPVICKVILFVIDLAQECIQIAKTCRQIIFNGVFVLKFLEPTINAIEDAILEGLKQIENGLNECREKEFGCDFEEDPTLVNDDVGELPVPTRCWSTYLTFFGDNQQLSCTRADTCKSSRTSGSDNTVCAACPEQTNPNIQDFACDYVTKLCTCAVPRIETTYCSSNDDCMIQEIQSSCRLLNDDLQISKSSLPCNDCQYQRMCYHDFTDAENQLGICVCGSTPRHFQLCNRDDFESQTTMSLILNNLCLFTPSRNIINFRESTVTQCLYLDPTTSSCAYVNEKNYYMVRGHRTARRRLLQVQSSDEIYVDHLKSNSSIITYNPLCQDAFASSELKYTRANCLKIYETSKETVQVLNMQNQLHACAFCSFEDVIKAVNNNPVAFLHIITSISHLRTVCSKHGPLQNTITFFTKLYTALKFTSQLLIADMNANHTIINNHVDRNGNLHIAVDAKIIPQHIAHSIEMFIQSIYVMTRNLNTNFSSTTNSSSNINTTLNHARHLLFFREMVDSLSYNFQESMQESEFLHQSFVSSVSHVTNYQYLGYKDNQLSTDDVPVWPPYQTKTDGSSCAELTELVNITFRVANGTLRGWQTILGYRNQIQSKPVNSLSKAWPSLTEATGVFRPSDNVLTLNASQISDDFVTYWTLTGLRTCLDFIGFELRTLFNFFYSLLIEAKDSFTCSYEAVQTCSEWHVRAWQGLLIVTVWFTIWALLANALGLSVLVSLSIPLHGLLLLRLCYGYTWTCLPMIPICAWQDFIESMDLIFPLSMELPVEMKKIDGTCLQSLNVAEETCVEMAANNANIFPTTTNSQFMCLQLPRYPSHDCLLTCKDPPFEFTSSIRVLTWILAELAVNVDTWFQTFTIKNAHSIPFFDDEFYETDLMSKITILSRDSASMIRAQRICATFSVYFLIPYMLLLLLIITYLSIFIQMIVTQLYPFILSITSLFAAVIMSSTVQSNDDDQVQEVQEVRQKPDSDQHSNRDSDSESNSDYSSDSNSESTFYDSGDE